MKNVWTLLCCVVLAASLTACKSSDTAPAEGEAAADSDSAEAAEATEEKVLALALGDNLSASGYDAAALDEEEN